MTIYNHKYTFSPLVGVLCDGKILDPVDAVTLLNLLTSEAETLESLDRCGAVDLTAFEGMTRGPWAIEIGKKSDEVFICREALVGKSLQKRVARAWNLLLVDGGFNNHERNANARAIAAVPKMIAEIRALRTENAELREAKGGRSKNG